MEVCYGTLLFALLKHLNKKRYRGLLFCLLPIHWSAYYLNPGPTFHPFLHTGLSRLQIMCSCLCSEIVREGFAARRLPAFYFLILARRRSTSSRRLGENTEKKVEYGKEPLKVCPIRLQRPAHSFNLSPKSAATSLDSVYPSHTCIPCV